MEKRYILNQQTIENKLRRMAYEIWENNPEEESLILIGIRDNGSVIAGHIKDLLERITGIKIELLHISLDKRDPEEILLNGEANLNNRVVIVIDDVANSGKTMLYSMKAILDAKPKKIQTLVLVERTHKAFPIHNDYVGLSVATTLQDHIYVEVKEEQITGAWME